eukprot:gene19956-biopygen8518
MCGWKVSLREIGNPIRNFGFLVRGNGVPIREDGVPMRVSGIALQGAGIPLREKRWTFLGGQKKLYTIQRCAVSGNGLQDILGGPINCPSERSCGGICGAVA